MNAASTIVPPPIFADDSGHEVCKIETYALRAPLTRRFKGSAYHMDNRCTIVTRIETRGGLVSEVYNGDTDAEQDVIVGIIHDELAPAIMQRNVLDPEGCWQAMEPAARNILRGRGLALQAMACVDTAVWDAFGKTFDRPLYQVWGAGVQSLPISVIGGYYHLADDEIASTLCGYADAGFSACKFKVGGQAPEVDRERVRLAREAVGPAFKIMVDANQGWTREDAVRFGRLARDLDIHWFEEPCSWYNDRLWMRDVRYQTGIPIAAGQSETTLAGLRDLITGGAIDVSNFDASWAGGPTVWRRAAGLAGAFGVQMGHHEEPQIAAHLLASTPNRAFVECFDEERDPFFWNIQTQRPQIANGHYRLPTGAGFGITLDWNYVDKYTVARRVTTA